MNRSLSLIRIFTALETTWIPTHVRPMSKLPLLLLALLLLFAASCKDDPAGPAALDSLGTVRFTIDGVTRVARVDSLSLEGERMVAHGHWNEQVIVAGASSSLLLECLLTSPARVGMHPIDSTSDSTSFFTLIGAVVGNNAGSETFRASMGGGSGTVTVDEISDTLVSGSMRMTLLNDQDRSESKEVTGTFNIRRE